MRSWLFEIALNNLEDSLCRRARCIFLIRNYNDAIKQIKSEKAGCMEKSKSRHILGLNNDCAPIPLYVNGYMIEIILEQYITYKIKNLRVEDKSRHVFPGHLCLKNSSTIDLHRNM